jgi:hypothetical protein
VLIMWFMEAMLAYASNFRAVINRPVTTNFVLHHHRHILAQP